MVSFLILLRNFTRAFRKSLNDEEFKGILILVIIALTIGTIFYSHVERWGIIDSLYFCVVTLLTVGYGDFVPTNDFAKIFTIFYILLGVGIILGFVNILAKNVIDNNLERRKKHKILNEKNESH